MDWFITWIHNTEASRRKKADDVRNDADLLLPGGVDPWKHKENRGFDLLQSAWTKKEKKYAAPGQVALARLVFQWFCLIGSTH